MKYRVVIIGVACVATVMVLVAVRAPWTAFGVGAICASGLLVKTIQRARRERETGV